MNARDTAVYWLEYVIRYQGAPYLQYPGIYLNFWQRNSLDVIAFLIISIYVMLKTFKFIFTKLKKIKKQ